MSKEAMKLALEALEENHHLIEEYERPDYLAHYDRVIGAIRKALAKQEQGEPVDADDFFRMIANRNPSPFSPQQRTWVGLTDEDLAVCGDEDDVMLARYWERVCKEKNT